MADTMVSDTTSPRADSATARTRGSLDADIIIANAPDPVFVADPEGKIPQANDAVSTLLGFWPDEVLEQSLSRFSSPEETREFTAAVWGLVACGVTRTARLNPRSISTYSIAKEHRGTTFVVSPPGQRVTILIQLPLDQTAARPKESIA